MRWGFPSLTFCIASLLFFPLRVWAEEPVEYRRYQDTQRKVTVDAYVLKTREGVLKVEWIATPPGATRLKSAELVSPEGRIYSPREVYEVSEQAARNLGRLRAVPVTKTAKAPSKKAKVGSFLLGTALSTLSGVSSSSSPSYSAASYGTSAAKTGSSALSTLGAVGGAVAPLAVNQAMGSGASRGGDVEWMEPRTAGTGILSSVAEFEGVVSQEANQPWRLVAEMEQLDGTVSTYQYFLDASLFASGAEPPIPPEDSDWREVRLTGWRAKLL